MDLSLILNDGQSESYRTERSSLDRENNGKTMDDTYSYDNTKTFPSAGALVNFEAELQLEKFRPTVVGMNL
jgi:hypothetical protein